jgi:hypothetical protein
MVDGGHARQSKVTGSTLNHAELASVEALDSTLEKTAVKKTNMAYCHFKRCSVRDSFLSMMTAADEVVENSRIVRK